MSLEQAQAKFETDKANEEGAGAEEPAYTGVAAPWATQADAWAAGYSQMAKAERRPLRRQEYNPPWAHNPALNRPQKSVDHPWASKPVDRGRPDNQGYEGTATYIDGGGAEAGNNGIILLSHADHGNTSTHFPKEAERKQRFMHRRMLDPENPPKPLDPNHKVEAPWEQDVGEGKVQAEVDDDEKLATSLVSWSDTLDRRGKGGTRSTYACGPELHGSQPLNRRKMVVNDEMKTLDSVPKQPKSVKPWESNISDDSEDEEGAPRSAVTLISAADKRNLVSKRGQSDPKLLEASLYNEKVVPNLNRRFIEPDDLKKRKKERKERDMAQAWGASLGKPRSKPVGMPEHETTAPWDLNASDGEDNSDPEVEPVTLVSWSDSYDKSAPGIKSTYASDARRAGTPGLARRRQKPDDRKEYNRKQRELGKEHAWAIAHGTKPAHAKVQPPWEATVSDDSEDEEGEPRQPVSLVSWADKRNYRSLKGQNDPLLMESSCYGERVVRNLNRRFVDPEELKTLKQQRHQRDTNQAWNASLGKPAAAPVEKSMKRADQTTSPWEKEISDEEEDPVTGEPMQPVAVVSNAAAREHYNKKTREMDSTLNVRRRTEEMKEAAHGVKLRQAWAASIGDERRGKPRYEPQTAGYEWYEAEESVLRSKQLAPRRVPFRREERLRCRKVWAALKEDAAREWEALADNASGGSRSGSRRGSSRPSSRASTRSGRSVRSGRSSVASSAHSAVAGETGALRYRQLKGVAWPPTNAPPPKAKLNRAPPDASLALEWVHGYRGFDRRHNVKFTANGEVVYYAAALAVVYDPQSNTQRYFMGGAAEGEDADEIGHDGAITAIAMAPDGRTVATGQICTTKNKSPPVCVWDSTTMEQRARLNVDALNEVTALAFSPDGTVLLSVSSDENNTITLTEWATGTKLAVARGGGNDIYGMAFNTTSKKPPKNEDYRTHAIEVVQLGNKHVRFYRHLEAALEIDAPEDYKPTQSTYDAAFMHDGSIVVGQDSGELAQFVYREDEDTGEPAEMPFYISSRLAHDGAATAVLATADGKGLITAGEDGRVLWWAQPDGMPPTARIDTLELKTEVHLPKLLGVGGDEPAGEAAIGEEQKAAAVYAVALSLSVLSSVVAVGTNTNVVLLLERGSDGGVSRHIVTEGHSGRVAGVVADPSTHSMVSCGEDNTCRIWCMRRHVQTARYPLKTAASSVSISDDGAAVALGMMNGRLDVLDVDSGKTLSSKPCRRKAIVALSFSPDGDLCAVAGRDNVVDVRDVKTWRSVGSSKPPLSSAVMSLDWSEDGEWIQVSTASGELQVLSTAASVNRNAAEPLRDTAWKSWTSRLGWPVAGIWPKYAGANSIKAVARSNSQQLLVTGGTDGAVSLFRYPCCTPGSAAKVTCGHGSHISSIAFSADDRYVMTAGGRDQCLLVWRVDGV